MKKYMKPTMEGQMFVSNEFVSACGDSGKTYYFECNAGTKDYDGQYPYKIYRTSNNRLVADSFEPCGETHVAEANDEFFAAYMDDKRTDAKEQINVMVWAEPIQTWLGTMYSYHCTDKLKIEDWETAKS